MQAQTTPTTATLGGKKGIKNLFDITIINPFSIVRHKQTQTIPFPSGGNINLTIALLIECMNTGIHNQIGQNLTERTGISGDDDRFGHIEPDVMIVFFENMARTDDNFLA
jgi:hypothetical protein